MPGYGVYVHLPWCRIHCPYCAFVVQVDRNAPFAAYTDALLTQWRDLAPSFEGRPDTLAFGGGTPSLAPGADIGRLIRQIDPIGEVSLEANPEDVSPERLAALRDAGVTRLSLGVQTFSPRFGRTLGRASKVASLPGALDAVAGAGFRSWSADLIFAVPGQGLGDFSTDLERLLGWSPPHLSLYGLSAEEGTPYTRALENGRFEAPDDELWAEMVDAACQRLAQAGLHRYEVSNYAREGHRSACNEHYWRARPYAGLGAGAHGWLPNGERTIGPPTAEQFIANPRNGEREVPDIRQRAVDLVLSTLRHVDGLPLPRLAALGFAPDPTEISRMSSAKLIEARPDHLALGPAGWAIADAVTRRIIETLKPVPLDPGPARGSQSGPSHR